MKAILIALMLISASPASAGWFCDREPPRKERVVEVRPAGDENKGGFVKVLTVGASVFVGVLKIGLLVVGG